MNQENPIDYIKRKFVTADNIIYFDEQFEGYLTSLLNKTQVEKELSPHFWFMRDNHTFIKLKGKDIHEIKKNAIEISSQNPYGMVCPVTIFDRENELKRVGKSCHVDAKGNVDVEPWFIEIMKEDCVKNYKGE